MSSFGPIAPHYNLLMATVPYPMWVEYYELLLLTQGLSPKTLLDVCCGTGTVAGLLTQRGYQVTGFDLSSEMIEEARRQLPDLDFFVADATNFTLNRRFEAAFSFFDSLNYITTLEGFRAAIHQVGAHLVQGGSFIFDLNTEYAFEQQMFTQQEKRKSAKIKYDWVGNYDAASRIIEVDMSFLRDGQEFKELHVQRAHSDEEVRDALKSAGFGEVHCYNSYSLEKPFRSSDRVHYTAIRQ